MKSNSYFKLSLLLIVLMFAIGFYFYPKMPEKMATHWNAKGVVDGYSSRAVGLFMMPIITLILYTFFQLIPKIDPLGRNIKKFEKYWNAFKVIFLLFMAYMYIVTLAANLGYAFNMNYIIMPAIAVLFYFCGILVENAKRNWFIGIRTPWTLSSDKVWKKTHKLGAKIFKLYAVVILFGLFFEHYLIWIILTILPLSLYLLIYSYLEWRKIKK